jgi:hypothetical protein
MLFTSIGLHAAFLSIHILIIHAASSLRCIFFFSLGLSFDSDDFEEQEQEAEHDAWVLRDVWMLHHGAGGTWGFRGERRGLVSIVLYS